MGKRRFITTIDDMRELAKSRKGECLSKRYRGSHIKLKWKCKEGHIWPTTPSTVKIGCWCPFCAGQPILTIKDMQKHAQKKGGKCLSRKFIKNNIHLKWQCKRGHKWFAVWANVGHGQWCPQCNKTKREQKVRATFEKIFKEEFPSAWPTWLKSDVGGRMELDGYCKKLRVAFEYNGRQHYQWYKSSLYYKTKKEFEEQQKRDKEKIKLCNQNNVRLVVVSHDVNFAKLEEFIKQEYDLKNG